MNLQIYIIFFLPEIEKIRNPIFSIIWACRLRRQRPVPSPRPKAVMPQSCKRSFLRSLFCSSGTSAFVLAGFPPTASRGGQFVRALHKII